MARSADTHSLTAITSASGEDVKINAAGYEDKEFVKNIQEKGSKVLADAIKMESEILRIVDEKIGA